MAATLPTLVKRAATTLANATTATEVLEAQAQANYAYDAAKAAARFAKAKGAFDEVMSAVYNSQADALEIEAAAKRRFANEYDAAQERGEIASRGANQHVGIANMLTSASLGVSRYDVHVARDARDAEIKIPGIIRESLDSIIVRGDEPSKAALGREINARLASFSGDNEWNTPNRYIELARDVMGGIDCDPASNEQAQATIRATLYYDAADDGLTRDWHGRVWLNPPFAHPLVSQFADKLLAEIDAGNTSEAIILTNTSVDTRWHQALQDRCALMCHHSGRIKFESGSGRESNGNAIGQTFLYFGPNRDRFAEVFRDVGSIWAPYRP